MARKVVQRGHVNKAEQPQAGLLAPAEGEVVATGPVGSGEVTDPGGGSSGSGSGSSSSNLPFPLPLDGEDGQDGEQGPPGPRGLQGAPGAPGMDADELDEEIPLLGAPASDSGVCPYDPVVDQVSTPLTLGDGTVTGLLRKYDRRVAFEIAFTVGSTTAFGTGALTFTLPSPASLLGAIVARIVGATTAIAIGRTEAPGIIALVADGGDVTHLLPVVLVAGDVITINGSYEE